MKIVNICRRINAENSKLVNSFKTNSKHGFTLAEVLITLGIIGIVAAMTIPNMITNNKARKLKAQFMESYSIIQQVFKQMEADDVSLDPKDYPTGTYYKTFMRYLQAPTDCNRKKMKVCYYYRVSDSGVDRPYKSLDGKADISGNYFDDGQIALQNGSLLLFENYTTMNNRIWVSVDLNGYNNPPNRWGVDLFTFQFVEGELLTMGAPKTYFDNLNIYCNPNVSNVYNGSACAQRAKTDSEYFNWVLKNIK